MKYRASFIAAGVTLAAAVIAGGILAAAAFHAAVPSPHLGEVTANPVAHQTSAGNTSRVYCFIGVKGDQDNLYRGWICVPDTPGAP
jgi:hypothetical protein